MILQQAPFGGGLSVDFYKRPEGLESPGVCLGLRHLLVSPG